MSIEISKIWYDPESNSYEGRADVRRNGRTFRYPCSVNGPMDMPMGEVRRRMSRQVSRMSDTPPALFSHIV